MRTAFVLLVFLLAGCRGSAPPDASALPDSPLPRSDASAIPREPTSEPTAEHDEAEASGTVALRFDETVRHRDLDLRLIALNDSRCPLGAQCFWEGQVVATIEVSRRDGGVEVEAAEESGARSEAVAAAETLELVLRSGHDQGGKVAAGSELRLTSVEPHPKEGVTPERSAHVVTVEIRTL